MKKVGQPSIFPPSRPVEILAVHVKPWKNPIYRDSNSRPNVSEGYEVTSELPGRPPVKRIIINWLHLSVIRWTGGGGFNRPPEGESKQGQSGSVQNKKEISLK